MVTRYDRREWIREEDNSLINKSQPIVNFAAGDEYIDLEGEFSIEDLKWIADWMRKTNKRIKRITKRK